MLSFSFLSSSELAWQCSFISTKHRISIPVCSEVALQAWTQCPLTGKGLNTVPRKESHSSKRKKCRQIDSFCVSAVPSSGTGKWFHEISLLFSSDNQMGRLSWNSDCWNFHPCLWRTTEHFHTKYWQNLAKLGPVLASRNKNGFNAPHGALYEQTDLVTSKVVNLFKKMKSWDFH